MEKIFSNLLSNALKFTPEGGSIHVAVTVDANGAAERMDEREKGRTGERESGKADAGSFDRTTDEASGKTGERELGVVHQNDRQGEDARGRPGAPIEYVHITVSDSGIGIPADRLPYIFDRFYQVDPTETREHEGSGIGLALTKELVALHGGDISVESRAGQGTTFTIRLPWHRAPAGVGVATISKPPAKDAGAEDAAAPAGEQHQPETAEETAAAGAPPKPHREAPLILVVEDNADVRQYLRDYLVPHYHVLVANDGREGLRIALERIPDLVISDVMMPHMDGIELCRTLKNDMHTSHIPLIMLTARAEDQDRIDGLQTGVDDYLIKPFNSRELLARIGNLIEQRRKLQEKYRRDFLTEPRDITLSSMEDQFLVKALAIVEEHISDPDLSVEQLAEKLAMSRTSLHRKISALTGQPATLFIRTLRLKRAARLLKQRSGTITEIAFDVGFTSSAYFTKCFREQYGKSPRAYQKSSE